MSKKCTQKTTPIPSNLFKNEATIHKLQLKIKTKPDLNYEPPPLDCGGGGINSGSSNINYNYNSNGSTKNQRSTTVYASGGGAATTTTLTQPQQQQYEFQQQQQQNIECYGCIKAWYRTKKYLNIVSDKVSTFSMECSTRVNKCGTWLCSRTNGGPQYHNPSEKFENSFSNNGAAVSTSSASSPGGTGTPTKPSVVIQHGPGPSPVSSVSCDETEPPPKNCYRLVVLG